MHPLATARGDYKRPCGSRSEERQRHYPASPSAPTCATTIASPDSRPDDALGPEIHLLAVRC